MLLLAARPLLPPSRASAPLPHPPPTSTDPGVPGPQAQAARPAHAMQPRPCAPSPPTAPHPTPPPHALGHRPSPLHTAPRTLRCAGAAALRGKHPGVHHRVLQRVGRAGARHLAGLPGQRGVGGEGGGGGAAGGHSPRMQARRPRAWAPAPPPLRALPRACAGLRAVAVAAGHPSRARTLPSRHSRPLHAAPRRRCSTRSSSPRPTGATGRSCPTLGSSATPPRASA